MTTTSMWRNGGAPVCSGEVSGSTPGVLSRKTGFDSRASARAWRSPIAVRFRVDAKASQGVCPCAVSPADEGRAS